MHATADCELAFKIGTASTTYDTFKVGLTSDSTNVNGNSWANRISYAFYIGNGEVIFYENVTAVHTIPAFVWAPEDEIKIARVGTTVSFYHNGSLIYTSLTPSSGNVWARSNLKQMKGALYDMTWTYDRPAYCLDVGDSLNSTGRYDPNFLHMNDSAVAHEVQINGAACPINMPPLGVGDQYENLLPPALGECSILPSAGLLFFNSGDVGKSVTYNGTVLNMR